MTQSTGAGSRFRHRCQRRRARLYHAGQRSGQTGIFIRGSAFEEEELTLAPGDTILLISDGLSEAENPVLQEFGEQRLIESLAGERHREPDHLLEFLLSRIREFAGTQPQNDDITAPVVRCPLGAAASA
jgi:serine/threonine protein phosphatase PrpC